MAGWMPVTILIPLPETLIFKSFPPLRFPTSSSAHQSLESILFHLNLKKIAWLDRLLWLIRMEKKRFVILLPHFRSSSPSSTFIFILSPSSFLSSILLLYPSSCSIKLMCNDDFRSWVKKSFWRKATGYLKLWNKLENLPMMEWIRDTAIIKR